MLLILHKALLYRYSYLAMLGPLLPCRHHGRLGSALLIDAARRLIVLFVLSNAVC